jgi:hypothetical protein
VKSFKPIVGMALLVNVIRVPPAELKAQMLPELKQQEDPRVLGNALTAIRER